MVSRMVRAMSCICDAHLVFGILLPEGPELTQDERDMVDNRFNCYLVEVGHPDYLSYVLASRSMASYWASPDHPRPIPAILPEVPPHAIEDIRNAAKELQMFDVPGWHLTMYWDV